MGIAVAILALYLLTHARTITTAAPPVPMGAALRVRAIAGGIGRFLPAGFAAGTGVLVTMLRSRGVRGEVITHTIAVTSVWNTLTKLLLPLVGVVAMAVVGRAPLAGGWEVAGLAVAALFAVGFGVRLLERPAVARRLARAVDRPLSSIALRAGRPPPSDLPARAVELQASTARALRRRPLEMGFWYTAHHLTQVALIYLGMLVAARGAGLEVGVAEVLTAFALGYLLTGLPISPGGLGTMDVVVVVTLTGLGEEAAVVSAGLAVYRIATYGLYTLALASWPLWRPARSDRTAPPRDR